MFKASTSPSKQVESQENVVRLIGARLSYPSAQGEVEVLRGVDLDIADGEILAITGPSGSGKSSLIALIGGLEQPSSGRVEVLGMNMSEADETVRTRLRRRDIGVVFQAYHLVPAMTALQNVALPLMLAGISSARDDAASMLERVGLGHRLEHRPSALSGGEQQRVAIARAFIAEPRLILADEPTGNLDQTTGGSIAETMFELSHSMKAAMLLVTHDPDLAERCDRRLQIDSGLIKS